MMTLLSLPLTTHHEDPFDTFTFHLFRPHHARASLVIHASAHGWLAFPPPPPSSQTAAAEEQHEQLRVQQSLVAHRDQQLSQHGRGHGRTRAGGAGDIAEA